MSDSIILFYKRLVFVIFIVVISLFLLAFILSGMKPDNSRVRAASSKPSHPDMSDSPNVLTSGMVTAADKMSRFADSTVKTIGNGIAAAGSAMVNGGESVARGVGSGVTSVGEATGKGLTFVSNVPGEVIGSVGSVLNDDTINAVIKPDNDLEIPIIDPESPELHAALASLPPQAEIHSEDHHPDSGPMWPMHGRITADFGVDHRPYQHTHTGLDISDGKLAGTTPAKPFRPGKVIEVKYSRQGLGNHVIVDHGNGVTSVYAHLNSISVSPGQEVNHATTIGFVGNTGISTGPHLHLEIRVNGKAADPKRFISGRP